MNEFLIKNYISRLKLDDINNFAKKHGIELNEEELKLIEQKDSNLKWKIETQWTTPRRYTDLIWSLCDLTSWSWDKWTPVVFIQWYFDNYSSD